MMRTDWDCQGVWDAGWGEQWICQIFADFIHGLQSLEKDNKEFLEKTQSPNMRQGEQPLVVGSVAI